MSSRMMMKAVKAFALIAITMVMATIAFNSISIKYDHQDYHPNPNEEEENISQLLPSKRVSRFLAESDYNHHGRSLKPADHCHKDYEVCDIKYGMNFTCCGNKCFDLTIDQKNCGGCHSKCKFTNECCDGKCVDKTYDKRHCGKCNQKCLAGQLCVYGLCDYA
ncbi:stigma-specific STIG1-like protein 3 [Chenopodium quinoa]|uniref:Stigma-specific Stig1 family protein n=1 Tax=Chenopodium quinoa TaxID=63459 RepID=A0A803LY46_CHEQI|nr:stigma-specific STIG1-like protein 3 [Chenopodium quinoa]